MTAVDQPAGEVTLVFSDIEGSTRLLEELGADAYREALAGHRRIVREAYGRHAGYEVDYEGDAFFYAFSSAPEAVFAVAEAMAGLEPGPIKIRVGIHTGTPSLDPPKYVGMDVHLAARVMSSAHGGQVVCSASTAQLVDVQLQDLGEHRLKDIAEAVPLFQLGEGSFPPLKTISNTNLPRPASSFVGRDSELAEVLSRIEAGARLVTLTGPGGTGKTRLALEAAQSLVGEYKAGIFWVGLATLRDPTLVTETIAQVLGAKDGLAAHISERELLLLVDNLEQVVEAAPEVSALLQACPNLTLLVTSRELLRVSGEVEYPVPPLAQLEAVSLFCERSGLEPSPEIAELCARLDSLPLAVELAAARSKALTPAQILERLASRLDLLRGGRDADPRQATLRATIAWSYELLTPDEQELFARLSVFAGGCTLEAAEEVADADLDTLQSLVEKSLLRFTPAEPAPRYWMLETIREYGGERLAQSPEASALSERQALHALVLAESAERRLETADGGAWTHRLEDERDNLRCALDWASASGNVEIELRLATALRLFWSARGPVAEGLRRLEDAVRHAGDLLPERRIDALRWAALSALRLGEPEAAERLAGEAAVLSRQLGDKRGEVSAMIKVAHAVQGSGDPERAQSLMDQAVAAAVGLGDPELLARALLNRGALAMDQGDFERTAVLSQESLRTGGEALGPDVRAIALYNLGFAWVRLGNVQSGVERLRQSAVLSQEHGDHAVAASALEALATVGAEQDPLRSARLLGAAHAVLEDVGDPVDDGAIRRVRAVAGDDEYERAHAEGRTLSLDAALALALGLD